MNIGLQIPKFDFPGGTPQLGADLAQVARTADEAGFYSLWVMDHFFQLGGWLGEADSRMMEAYTTLGYLAGVTEKVKLGTMVTGVIYRYPALLIKTVTSLDVVSGGRAYFGVGAAWYEREARGLGVPFPPTSERFEYLEETLQIAKQMWSGDTAPFEGQHFQLREPLSNPQPVSQPHPPILIGGEGERKTLRMVAQYADACNLFGRNGIDHMKRKLEVLRQHCEDLGRPYEDIEKTVLGTVHLAEGEMSIDDILKTCRELADIGIDHYLFNMPNVHEIEPLRGIGREVIPAVADW